MSYLQLEHDFFKKPKHAGLSDLAVLMHLTGIHYCSDALTDGFLPKRPASLWAMHLVESGRDIPSIVAELVDAGLWADAGDQWHIVDYLDRNLSKAQIRDRAARKAENQRAYRERKDAQSQTSADSPNPVDEYKEQEQALSSTDRTVTGHSPVTGDHGANLDNVTAIRDRLNGGAA